MKHLTNPEPELKPEFAIDMTHPDGPRLVDLAEPGTDRTVGFLADAGGVHARALTPVEVDAFAKALECHNEREGLLRYEPKSQAWRDKFAADWGLSE